MGKVIFCFGDARARVDAADVDGRGGETVEGIGAGFLVFLRFSVHVRKHIVMLANANAL